MEPCAEPKLDLRRLSADFIIYRLFGWRFLRQITHLEPRAGSAGANSCWSWHLTSAGFPRPIKIIIHGAPAHSVTSLRIIKNTIKRKAPSLLARAPGKNQTCFYAATQDRLRTEDIIISIMPIIGIIRGAIRDAAMYRLCDICSISSATHLACQGGHFSTDAI